MIRYFILAGALFAIAACTPRQQLPTLAGPVSLQLVHPEYYSRTLRYQVRHRHKGRIVTRTVEIPVRINRKTEEVTIVDSEKAQEQLEVIEQRIDQVRSSLRSHERKLQKDKRDAATPDPRNAN